MAESGFEILGIPQLERGIEERTKEGREKGGRNLVEVATEYCSLAKEKTPVRTGRLRDTGQVIDEGWTLYGERAVMISFGGGEVDWAVPVHERLHVRHLNGQAKYLESVLLEKESVFELNIQGGSNWW